MTPSGIEKRFWNWAIAVGLASIKTKHTSQGALFWRAWGSMDDFIDLVT